MKNTLAIESHQTGGVCEERQVGIKLPDPDDLELLTNLVQIILLKVCKMRPGSKHVKDISRHFLTFCLATTSLLQYFYNSADDYAVLFLTLLETEIIPRDVHSCVASVNSSIEVTLPRLADLKDGYETFRRVFLTKKNSSLTERIRALFRLGKRPKLESDLQSVYDILDRLDAFWKLQACLLYQSTDPNLELPDSYELHEAKDSWKVYQEKTRWAITSIQGSVDDMPSSLFKNPSNLFARISHHLRRIGASRMSHESRYVEPNSSESFIEDYDHEDRAEKGNRSQPDRTTSSNPCPLVNIEKGDHPSFSFP